MASQPASKLQLASQQAIWQNVNLTLSQISGVSILYINTQVTFCQMASQPANCNWPVNQSSDKMQPNQKLDPWGGSGWHLVRWPVSQPASQMQLAANKPSDKMSTWPKSDPWGVHLMHQYTSDILSDGQPATAIGQSTSHLTKCQHNPKSDSWEGQLASQPASCNWSANKPYDRLSTWPLVRSWGYPFFTSIHKWHFVRWQTSQPASCNWPANQPSGQMSTWPKASS